MSNNLNTDNLQLLSSILNKPKDNSNKLLKTNSNQVTMVKNMLPYLSNQNSPILDKIINTIEISQFINDYKLSYNTISTNQVFDLKKETIDTIKSNINEDKKYMVDVLLKFLEINEIVKNKGEKNGL